LKGTDETQMSSPMQMMATQGKFVDTEAFKMDSKDPESATGNAELTIV